MPDRLLAWDDYVPKKPRDSRAAETAVQFSIDWKYQRLIVTFDLAHSWVKPELVDPQTPLDRQRSDRLLAHEQVHYLISCLVVRQANQSITPNEELSQMLSFVRSVAQRLNLQYDRDTQHGTLLAPQESWEKAVMEQLIELDRSGHTFGLVHLPGSP